MKEPVNKPVKREIKRHTKTIEIAGKKYKLTYPGMRMVNRWRRESTEIKDGKAHFDVEKYLDFAFDCVEPVGHNFYPTQDDIDSPTEGEEWSAVLPRFLRGDALEDFQGKKKEKTSKGSS